MRFIFCVSCVNLHIISLCCRLRNPFKTTTVASPYNIINCKFNKIFLSSIRNNTYESIL